MIRKTQMRFICTIMAILLAVFAVIFWGMQRILSVFNVNHINSVLTIEASNIDVNNPSNEDFFSNNEIIAFEDTIIFDSSTYSKKQAEAIYNTAKNSNLNFGNISTIYYKFINRMNSKIFIAIDFANEVTALRANVRYTLIILSIIYAILAFIVWMLSWRVVRPLKDSFNRQAQFISDASHELKTPLTIISANADVIKQTQPDNPWVENIKQQTERMEDLVSDMLTLAKTEEKKVKLCKEDINLSDEILNISLSFDALAFEKNIILNSEIYDNIHIWGDRSSIRKVCSILLDNAIKYANRYITISLYKKNEKTILEVFNDGSNIPDEDSNRIFERFYRGDSSRSRESGGSGLGLAIAKEICDNNKWKISAKSELEKSMTIVVVIA